MKWRCCRCSHYCDYDGDEDGSFVLVLPSLEGPLLETNGLDTHRGSLQREPVKRRAFWAAR